VGGRLKSFLNAQAGTRLEQLGYSGGMVSDAKREAWWWLQARGRALAVRRGLRAGTAVVWTDAGRAELVRADVALAGPGEVTVSVHASAVSPGTERAQYLRLPNAEVDYPHRPGYSAAGVVVEVGQGVTGLQLGDRVAVRGLAHSSLGTVPAAAAYRIPAGVDLRDAALVELGVIGGQGVRHARLDPGTPVCVLGAGLVGALAQRLAAAAGAGDLTVVARTRAKEAIARAGGALSFVLAHDAEAIAAVAAPVVIEATGDPDAIATAVEAAAPGGRVVLLGSPRGATRSLPVELIRAKELELVGAHVNTLAALGELNGTDEFRAEAEAFLSALGEGRLWVSDLLSEVVDPREADAFYRRLGSAGDIVGAVFDWTRLPLELRESEAGLARLPDLSAAGVDAEQRPLRARPHARNRGSRVAEPKGRLRIGLLGCGDIAVQNAAAVMAAPNAELVAAFDPIAELAEDLTHQYGGSPLESAEAVLDRPDVDAVLLSVPHHLHAPLCLQAVDAGKHVIVEKPLANNLTAARAMADAAAAAGVVLSVCLPHRYEPSAVAARRLIVAGALGEFSGSIATIFADKPASYWLGGFTGRSVSSWRASREQAGGGVLIMNLSHYIDLLRHLAGVEAEEVSAVTYTEGSGEVEDAISLTVRYANGAPGTIFGSAALRGYRAGRNELRLWGTEGHIALEPHARVYTTRAIDGLRTCRWHELEGPPSDMRTSYFTRLATAIAEGREPDVTAEDGLAVQAFVEAAYRSQELRTSVRPEELLGVVATR
jgi:2-desacetyl-2-hydroxyethyl bacteriochlorophyllide A dehydrogenase